MTRQEQQTAGVAIASLVLGILGMILIGPLGSIPAVICGHVAKSRIRQAPDRLAGDGLALAGLILGYVQIGFMVFILPLLAAVSVPSFLRAREETQLRTCLNNLRLLSDAVDQIAVIHNYLPGANISEETVSEYLLNGFDGLVCPQGGRYIIHPLGEEPECTEHGTLSNFSARE